MTAAAARKLQKEIDNVLKKVDDGITEFDDYWEQATATGGQQKERLGEELKKSINKLQRLRAQMREWIGQSSVPSAAKDKLEDARRRIEHDMQRFKEFERDLKTKAFSTCALAKEDELDLEEAEKIMYQEWLTNTIQVLSDQLDSFEADLELLGNKKSLSSDDKSRSAQYKSFQERHRWHSKKLEQILRAVDNDALDMSDLAVIRESVDLYVESHQDQDYYHDEGLYDCFDLADYEEKAVKPRSPSTLEAKDAACGGTPVSSKEEPLKKSKDKEKQRKADKKDKKKEEKEKKAAANSGTPNNAGGSTKAGSTSPHIISTIVDKANLPVLDQLDLNEVKVQEDQLLSEAEEFVCKICQIHVVGCTPKLTSCSHLFCGDCIAQWFAQHPESQTWAQRAKAAGPERVVPCPVCKQPLNEKKDLYPVCGVTSRSENLLLWRMLSGLKIMCANHPKANPKGQCEWIGEYGSYQKHIEKCRNLPGNAPLEEGTASLGVASDAREAPSLRLPVASVPPKESEADDSSEDGSRLSSRLSSRMTTPAVSRLTTPAVTPAMAASSPPMMSMDGSSRLSSRLPTPSVTPAMAACSPPAVRVSPLPTPVLKPQEAPRSDVGASSRQANDRSSPASATLPQARQSPVAIAAAAHVFAESSRGDPRGASVPVFPSPSGASSSPPGAAKQAGTESRPSGSSPLAAPPSERPVVNRVKAESETETVITPAPSAKPAHSPAGTPSHELKTASAGARQAAVHEDRKETSATKESANIVVVKAASSFEPTGTNMVHVQVGDRIQVLEQHGSGWTYCKNLSSSGSSNTGWVPSWISQASPAAEPRPQVTPQAKPKVVSAPSPAPAAAPVVVPGPASQPAPSPSAPQASAAAAPAQSGSAAPAEATPHQFVRVTAPFCAATASQLSLSPADLVDIVERHSSGWTYGRKVLDPQSSESSQVLEGWFPDWVVCLQK